MFQRYILENRSVATTQQEYKHKQTNKNQPAAFAAFCQLCHICTSMPKRPYSHAKPTQSPCKGIAEVC